ncbi:MAG: PAS domain-containing sensor histidine kinase [Flavobacterium psychrophilum]|nr:MAG: PAS domain-containing sensor histidine kinase [Flavobacterium psychrophilum]
MKIKIKLALASGLLFLLITVLSAIAIRQVNLLASDTKNILTDNYLSLDYCRNMYKILDNENLTEENLKHFNTFLDKQKSNVTEVGEKELTDDLVLHYSEMNKDITDDKRVEKVRTDLNSIMKLNMDSIQRKSNIADSTAKDSVLWLSLTSAFCFVIGFTLILNLPGYIANPIRDLTESIRQIAAKNYSQRIYFKGHTEFNVLAKSFNTMAEKLQEYSNTNLAQLMMEKKRIETLIDNLSDPVIGLDENRKILFINEQALQITGLTNENVIGQQAEDLALKNDLLRVLLQKMISGNQNISENIKIYSNQKESHFEQIVVPISITPTGETEKKQIGTFLILRNVTAYKELDTAKTNFIATVSHEFKTPIASMKMSIQLLENDKTGELNEEQKNLVDSLKDDAERLLRTTGELLNITQVETGKSQFKIESAEVSPLIDEAINATVKLAQQKNITVLNNSSEYLPEIIADIEKAQWIVSNLLSNAIRYSHENAEVDIKTYITPTHIEIAISDYGIGISPEYQDKVFEKYFRVPGNEKEGTGLGLSISKEFLAAMGGYIHLKSDIGKGSIFTAGFKRSA